MAEKKPWTVDPSGHVDTAPPGFWARVKWGQLLSFSAGSLLFFAAALDGYDSDGASMGSILFALGIAFRVIDVWQSKRN